MPLMSNVEAQMKYMLLIYLDELAGGLEKAGAGTDLQLPRIANGLHPGAVRAGDSHGRTRENHPHHPGQE